MGSRFKSAIQDAVNLVDNNLERTESWCLKLIRNIISLVLPREAADDWE